MGPLSKDQILRVAGAVSKLRSRYLAEVIKLGATASSGDLVPTAALELRELREAYEEALQGFGALRHAMERGYVDMEK